MMDALPALEALVQAGLWTGFAVFVRLGAMLALLPLFGEASIPTRVRLGLALAFTLVVAPAVAGTVPRPGTFADALALLGGEVLAGLALGIYLRFFVWALQAAGAIAAQATSLAQLFGAGPGGEPSPAVGHLLLAGGLALAALLGLHVQAAAYMIEGYRLLPPGAVRDPAVLLDAGVAEAGRSVALAVSLAMPFVAGALLYNVTLGVINRAMPALMVTMIGAPALTAGGLALLMLAAPVMLMVWADALGAFLRDPFAP